MSKSNRAKSIFVTVRRAPPPLAVERWLLRTPAAAGRGGGCAAVSEEGSKQLRSGATLFILPHKGEEIAFAPLPYAHGPDQGHLRTILGPSPEGTSRPRLARFAQRRLRPFHRGPLHQARRTVRRLQSRQGRDDRARDPGRSGRRRRRGRRRAQGAARMVGAAWRRTGASSLRARAACAEARTVSQRAWKRSTTASRSAKPATSTCRWSRGISIITPAGPRW